MLSKLFCGGLLQALEKKGARLGSTVGQADDAMAKATHL